MESNPSSGLPVGWPRKPATHTWIQPYGVDAPANVVTSGLDSCPVGGRGCPPGQPFSFSKGLHTGFATGRF